MTNGCVRRIQDGQSGMGRGTVVLQSLMGLESGSGPVRGQSRSFNGGSTAAVSTQQHPTSLHAGNGGGSASARVGNDPRSQQSQPAGSIIRYMDTMTNGQADAINASITEFIVGCALPFNIVYSIFFIALLRLMRPAFIEQKRLKSRTWFSTKGLNDLYKKTPDKIQKLFEAIAMYAYFTLAGDGFKTEANHKVVNFSEQASDKVAFKVACGGITGGTASGGAGGSQRLTSEQVDQEWDAAMAEAMAEA